VFAEPVTDEIAPGYSKIIKNPMDCYTMRLKIENNEYLTVKEFKVMDELKGGWIV
jgi:bromodomain-containing protein 7/9